MFNFFKKKTEVEKLEIKYKKLLEASYKLSHTNRKESDNKMAEAEEVLKQIEAIKNKPWIWLKFIILLVKIKSVTLLACAF